MICFTPKRFMNWLPRGIELLIIPIPYMFVVFILCELGIFDIIFYQTMNNPNSTYIYIMAIYVLLLIHNIYQTSTIVNKIIIDGTNQNVAFHYSKYYFLYRKRVVDFKDFSFTYYDAIGLNTLSFHDYKVNGKLYSYRSVKVFKNNKKVVKLVSRNGWEKEIVDNIIEEFNKITPIEKSPDKFI